MQVLYVVFTEGHSATSGPALDDASITAEAIRITRMLHAARPDHGEVAGLLALMVLTEARRPARTDADGRLVPLADQDRSRWDAGLIAEGAALLARSLPHTRVGPYQLQAAIAAVHDESPTWAATDWPQILQLYRHLLAVAPGPIVRLSAAVALAMVEGPQAGLLAVAALADDPLLRRSHRLPAVRAHLLEDAGQPDAARAEYLEAATLATSRPEQRYLRERAARLVPPD